MSTTKERRQRFSVRMHPGAKQDLVVQSEDFLTVYTRQPARQGQANEALVSLLAKHFKVPQKAVRLILGRTAREKLVEITFED